MKTSELIGPALDWAVTKCEGRTAWVGLGGAVWCKGRHEDGHELDGFDYVFKATDWAMCGPIIDREKIDVSFWTSGGLWHAACPRRMRYDSNDGEYIDGSDGHSDGPTPLIAAMRCYVASKLGEEVEVPDELA